MKFQTGAVFGNRYTLGDRIAVGGMGEVWRATDEVLGRSVAIKLLSPSLADEPGFARRFREEARHTAQLGHTNIAAVYDYGEDSGASWLVMELVNGKPLSQIIKEEAPLPPRRVSAIMSQAAQALQAAHEHGVIHRDVKPANILVRNDGLVKLTDFGIARAVDSAPITRTGEVMGTAQYVSPEQAMGKPVGPGSDLYALGVVAYEMLTGKRPFNEESPVATAMAHVHNTPPPLPSSVTQPLASVVESCLAKDPNQRPHSGSELAAALAGAPLSGAATEVLTSRGATTRKLDTTPERAYAPMEAFGPTTAAAPVTPEPPKRRRKLWIWLLPAVVVIGLLGYLLTQAGLFSGSSPLPTAPPTATTSTPETPTTTVTTTHTVLVDAAAFRGLTLEEARDKLRRMGLTQSNVLTESSTDVPAERVISIQPTGDVVPGTVMTITLSSGPAQTTSPETETSQPTTSDEGDNGQPGSTAPGDRTEAR